MDQQVFFQVFLIQVSKQEDIWCKKDGSFTVKKLAGKNAIWLDLPDYTKICPIVCVLHTITLYEQLGEIALLYSKVPDPFPTSEDEKYEIKAILNHGKKEKKDINSWLGWKDVLKMKLKNCLPRISSQKMAQILKFGTTIFQRKILSPVSLMKTSIARVRKQCNNAARPRDEIV